MGIALKSIPPPPAGKTAIKSVFPRNKRRPDGGENRIRITFIKKKRTLFGCSLNIFVLTSGEKYYIIKTYGTFPKIGGSSAISDYAYLRVYFGALNLRRRGIYENYA